MEQKIPNLTKITILDGGLGTMLQNAGQLPGQSPVIFGMENPAILEDIHRQYIAAGADIICTNTFSVNTKKLDGTGITVENAINAAVKTAAKAAKESGTLVALDIGPIGEMLEPGGTLHFEEAYEIFKEIMTHGQAAGADIIFIETMTDLYETKAAVLAARENTSLPVFVSMSFEEDGRTFSGASVEAFAAAIGGLKPNAIGINCSLGPAQIAPLIKRLSAATSLPVFAKPNNGLPNPASGKYELSASEFATGIEQCIAEGVCMVGGCCGTTPETIKKLAELCQGKTPQIVSKQKSNYICGNVSVLNLDDASPVVVGERINPTGKKALAQALLQGDIAIIQTMAAEQEKAGADILGVNVGAPGVDEEAVLPRAVKAVQAVSGLPLQIDSSNPKALAAALRVCNGKPVINSTSGEKEKLNVILPICAKYGAALVGLTLDEDGIPEKAEDRLKIAEKIVTCAEEQGISHSDIIIDCLTLAAGAMPSAAAQTTKAVSLVKNNLGVKTILGVSNISYGLPNRPLINRTFLVAALENGLDLAIINPADTEMMNTIAAFRLLKLKDDGGKAYISRIENQGEKSSQSLSASTEKDIPLKEAIELGLKDSAAAAAKKLIGGCEGELLDIVNGNIIPALDTVGKAFEEKRIYLPQLLAAADAASAAFEVLDSSNSGNKETGPPVVIATVKGDVHDIGKNIAKSLLQNYGFNVTDLGRDVAPQDIVDAAKKTGAKLVGLSALMTTTLPAMEETIILLHKSCPECKILVAGAVLTESYSVKIGADFFAKDTLATTAFAREVYSKA